MPDPIKLEIGGTLPGESIVSGLIQLQNTTRATMSQKNRDDWDHLSYVMIKGWHNWWVANGWPGEKID
jgi:hypothetical protein